MSPIEIIGLFIGRRSGPLLLLKEIIYPMRGRKSRDRQIESAVQTAQAKRGELINTPNYLQDPRSPAHE